MAAAAKTHRLAVELPSTSSCVIPPPPLLPALSSFESVRRRLAYKDDVDDIDDATSVCTTNGTEVDFYSGSDDDSEDDEKNKSAKIISVVNFNKELSVHDSNTKSDITEDDDDDGDLYEADGTCSVGVMFNAKTPVQSEGNCSALDPNNNVAKLNGTSFKCSNSRCVKTPTNDSNSSGESNCSSVMQNHQHNRPSQPRSRPKHSHRSQKMHPVEPEFLWAHHVQTVFASPPPSALLPPLSTNPASEHSESNQFDHPRSSTAGDNDQNVQQSDFYNSKLSCDRSPVPVVLPPHEQSLHSPALPVTKPTSTARRKLLVSKTCFVPSSLGETHDDCRSPITTKTNNEEMSLSALAAARAALQSQQQQTFPPSTGKQNNIHRFYMLTPQSSESGGSSFNTTPTSLFTSTALTTAPVASDNRHSSRTAKTHAKPFTIMSPVDQQQHQPQTPSSSPAAAFHDYASFDAYDMRLQQHVRFAIEQVREAAKLQVLQERNARRQRAFDRPRLAQYLPAGKFRFDRALLSSLCGGGTSMTKRAPGGLSHLQVIVQELYDTIEKRNDELVQLLVLRDELSMEQDSILVDLQDLQRRVREKMLSKSAERSAVTQKLHLPKSCSLTFPQQQNQPQTPDRLSSFAQRLFAKGLGRRTSFGASNQNNTNCNGTSTAPPQLPVSPCSTTVQSSPLAMLGQRFFSLINFNSANSVNQNVDTSKYQPVSLHIINCSNTATSSNAGGAPVGIERNGRCGETASESGRESGRDVDDDDDDDDYYYDED